MSFLGTEREGSSSDNFGPSGSTFSARPLQTTISGRVPAPRWASPWWLLFLGLAIAEVVALGVREHRVPSEGDWAGAAEFVRAKLSPKDAITVAPDWADPLLRLYLGDRITTKIAGRSDLAAFDRLWVLSIRGKNASDAPHRPPDFAQAFGRVRVERFDFEPSKVLLDLADAINSARVEMRTAGVDEVCALRTFPPTVVHSARASCSTAASTTTTSATSRRVPSRCVCWCRAARSATSYTATATAWLATRSTRAARSAAARAGAT
jgi:hypothetical protein